MTDALSSALPSTSRAAFEARALIVSAMRRWRCLADMDTVRLLTSELVTNALTHAREPLAIRAYPVGAGVRVEVGDGSARTFPLPRTARRPLSDGRGLELVEAMASRWGWRRTHGGKVVWFEVDAG
jgi:anti-sigma regulatory factor (Ser/Thr protein kinase)